jgi:hypothetical protein
MAYGESPGSSGPGRNGHEGGEASRRLSEGSQDINKGRVDILAGVVPKTNRIQAAVRVGDVRALLEIPPYMQSDLLSVPPGTYDFNSLVKDVKAIYAALAVMNETVRKRANFDGKLPPIKTVK